MAEYKTRYTQEEKRNKLHTFNSVYYDGDPDDWKVSRLPDWMEFYGHSLLADLDHSQPRYYRKLKQRMIVMVAYGVTIGDEMGGKHFAVVLSSKDNKYKKKAIVVPLSSHYHRGYVSLGMSVFNEISKLALSRIKELSNKNNALTREVLPSFGEYQGFSFIFKAKNWLNNLKKQNEIIDKIDELDTEIKESKVLVSKLRKYNKHTYANPAEIRTISKLRISKFTKFSISGNTQLDQITFEKLEKAIIKNI